MLRSFNRNSRTLTVAFGASAVFAVLLIILFPDRIFQASLKSLEIWWQIVFPALLPFFILTDLLAGFGFFHLLGKLLKPVMRLLFRLPGETGWAIACGMTAGFPTGAHATAALRRQGLLTVQEGERLLALSHFCSPILLMHVVAIGFFQDLRLGWMLIIIHIVSLLLTGMLLRSGTRPSLSRHSAASRRNEKSLNPPAGQPTPDADEEADPIVTGPPDNDAGFGKKLGDAVMSSIQKLMGIGGIMIVFAVCIELIRLVLTHLPFEALAVSLSYIGITNEALMAALSSLFEVHLAAFQFGQAAEHPQLLHIALLSSLFAWSGLSAHLQVQSIVRNTGLRYRSFMYARLLHAGIAFLTACMLWDVLHRWLPRTIPGFYPLDPEGTAGVNTFSFWAAGWSTMLTMFAATLLGLICLSLISRIFIRKG